MNDKPGAMKRPPTRAEAFGLGFFYAGMVAVFLYAILNLVRHGGL